MNPAQKEKVLEIANPVAEAHGVTVLDLQFVTERGSPTLRVVLDREGPIEHDAKGRVVPKSHVSVEDCQMVSRDLSLALDVHELWSSPYRLEVTSPGLDRPLIRAADFERYQGHEVRVQTTEPHHDRKTFVGVLKAHGDSIEVIDGKVSWTIPLRDVSKAQLIYRF